MGTIEVVLGDITNEDVDAVVEVWCPACGAKGVPIAYGRWTNGERDERRHQVAVLDALEVPFGEDRGRSVP